MAAWDIAGEGRWKTGPKKQFQEEGWKRAVVFIKGAGAGMVQELSGCDKEMEVVQ